MVFLKVFVVSVLIQSVFSLNHGSFIGVRNNDTDALDGLGFGNIGTADFLVPDNLLEFFAPLPPLPLPPTKKPSGKPTTRPSKRPTPSPVVTPTSPPIPAGRFPSPVATPTIRPVSTQLPVTAPVPEGRWPEQASGTLSPKPSRITANDERPIPPTFTTDARNNQNNQRSPPTFLPQTPPSANPVPAPTNHPVSNLQRPPIPTPTQVIVPVQPKIDTRISSYTAEWGSTVNQCEHEVPNIFFVCHGGGIIEINESKNAQCTKVSHDRAQCKQDEFQSDSSIEFTCSGIEKVHLMSTATFEKSFGTNCKNGGNAVKFVTLRRQCGDLVDVNQNCDRGMPWKQEETAYCASPAICDKHGIAGSCDDLLLEPVIMSNTNADMSCSRVVADQDMQNHLFDASSLASITLVDWRVSGQSRGCLWESSPLLMRCQDGGILEFMENYPFCSVQPDENVGECQSFAPFSAEREESVGIFVKCTGQTENQLILTAEIPSESMEVECDTRGTVIQSIMLSRGCGEYGTDGFTLLNHPSFCNGDEQIFTTDNNHSYCYVGDTCMFDEGCNHLQLAPLIANTRSNAVKACINVE